MRQAARSLRMPIYGLIVLCTALSANVLTSRISEAAGPCAIFKSFATGGSVTASDLNSIQTVLGQTNAVFSCLDDYSATAAQMQTTTDPYPGGVESLATTGQGEIERLRYLLQQIHGRTYWYQDPDPLNPPGDIRLGVPSTRSGKLVFAHTSSAFTVTFQAGSAVADTAYVLPTALPTGNGQLLSATTAGAMSWSTVAIPRAYLAGLTLSNGTDTVNDINVAAGSATDSTNAATLTLATGLTKQLDAAWAVGTNQGMRDAGAIADGTWHLFLITRLDTGVVDVLASLSPTAPTLPASYTLFRRIGSIIRSTTILAFTQDGDYVRLTASIKHYAANNPGTSAITMTTGAPTGIAVQALLTVAVQQSTTDLAIVGIVSDLAATDEAPSATAAPLASFAATRSGGAGSPTGAWSGVIRTNTSAQARIRLSASDANTVLSSATLGWYDTRGRDL